MRIFSKDDTGFGFVLKEMDRITKVSVVSHPEHSTLRVKHLKSESGLPYQSSMISLTKEEWREVFSKIYDQGIASKAS